MFVYFENRNTLREDFEILISFAQTIKCVLKLNVTSKNRDKTEKNISIWGLPNFLNIKFYM